MKTILSFLLIVLLGLAPASMSAQGGKMKKEKSKSAAAKAWKTYGGEITMKKALPVGKVLANPESYKEQEILVEGTITQVCENKGCWMVVGEGKKTIRVEFKDYGFFVPWKSEGKKVRMQGVLGEKTISAKAAEHMAGEMKDAPLEKEKMAGDQTIMVFTANAVAIRGGTGLSQEQQDVVDGKKEVEGHAHEDHQ